MLAKFLLGASKRGQLQFVGRNISTWVGSPTTINTISLTALTGGIGSSAQVGDLVIAAYAVGAAVDRNLSITDGTNEYTIIGSELYSSGILYDTNLRVAYKILTSADASVSFGPTGSTTDAGCAAVHVWRGASNPNPLDVTPTTATGTGTGQPNPPSITPVTSGSKIIVVGASAATVGAAFSAGTLSGFVSASSPDNNDAVIGMGYADWTSGAYDPAQFTGGTTNAANSWAAMTIAIRPA